MKVFTNLKTALLIALVIWMVWIPSSVQAAGTFTSPQKQVTLVELYVSEGCSSCPPAQKWASNFLDNTHLWDEVIPVVFHVDYWDYLGWKDPFSSQQFTERQRILNRKGIVNSVYTPGFVVNGKEWRGWFQGGSLPSRQKTTGKLSVQVENGRIKAQYLPVQDDPARTFNVAILGCDQMVDVKSGENSGRRIKEDFVVLAHATQVSQDNHWTLPVPEYSNEGFGRIGIAFWVEAADAFRPLQATGGWVTMR